MTATQTELQLDTWIGQARRGTRRRPVKRREAAPGLRFAFYGRTSTERFQDRRTSHGWQREVAAELVSGHGRIVREFFDVGVSRRVPWQDRPKAVELLELISGPDRPFDAIVVGEYERAFFAEQLNELLPWLEERGVQVWLPEAAGAVEMGSPTHQALMTVLGAQAQREVVRARHRVLAAMRVQAAVQGRYMGGRPPYGYRLADAGPHPNQAHARWGRRLHRLEPDPATAAVVRWIFAVRRAGWSIAAIARQLNERRIPCPSRVDRARNPHRSGEGWTGRTIASMLENPRYTGRQVWNRQRTDHDPHSVSGRSWNDHSDWVISDGQVHPPLVSEADFVAVQAVRAARATADGDFRRYRLSGLVICGLCGRRMDAHWANQRPGYRCRHGHTSAKTRTSDQPRNLYIREDRLLDILSARLNLTDHERISPYLKASKIVIVCGPGVMDIRPVESTKPGP
ncbi:recombinase family protein [Sphaerimonospora sp. CA-214678]|uniref:recombinase family protein n=1 Tax=Sphaerimonospora sp. CA-214678 TaxID=3240029 RepID=UPI003D8B081E